jgi:hypothetical protein
MARGKNKGKKSEPTSEFSGPLAGIPGLPKLPTNVLVALTSNSSASSSASSASSQQSSALLQHSAQSAVIEDKDKDKESKTQCLHLLKDDLEREAKRAKEELEKLRGEVDKLGEELAQLTVLKVEEEEEKEEEEGNTTSESTNINNSGANNIFGKKDTVKGETQSGSGHRAAQGEAAVAVALLSGNKKV